MGIDEFSIGSLDRDCVINRQLAVVVRPLPQTRPLGVGRHSHKPKRLRLGAVTNNVDPCVLTCRYTNAHSTKPWAFV